MDYAKAKKRLLEIMTANDGRITAGLVERDAELADNRELVSAAAHELATEPDVVSGEETDAREWFPYSFLMRA